MDNKYLTVFALNKFIKNVINSTPELSHIYIQGEISNYRPHPSGHIYFTLKDEKSKINAVMFKSNASKLSFKLENGMQVLITGSVSVYEANGNYQLYVTNMTLNGIGQLHEKYEALKKQLNEEGLFDKAHKKLIPRFPSRIAVLSASQGAAVQDIVRTLNLRFPFSYVVVFPIPVQGIDAYKTIIKTLNYVDTLHFSTILLARGGGSIEDLWNFNEEDLARCIYNLNTPIITGIGHEIDFTIADFVADLRAVTPTAAAIEATPDYKELQSALSLLTNQLITRENHILELNTQKLERLQNNYFLKNPEYYYSNESLKLSNLNDHLNHLITNFYTVNSHEVENKKNELKNIIDKKIKNTEFNFLNKMTSLDALSPLKIMGRGYSLVYKDDQIVKYSSQVEKGDVIDIRLVKDMIKAKVQ